MPRISIENYDTVASWNGSQDLFVVEQPDGTKVATPAMVKQFIEAGNFTATGEITDGHGNILKDMAKSADVATALAGKQDNLTVETYEGNLNFSGKYKAYKYGRVVHLKIYGVVNPNTSQQMILTESFPTAIRPMVDVNVVGMYGEGGFNASAASVNYRIEATGKIWTYAYQAFSSGTASITYVSAQ